MTPDEAADILGIDEDASAADILAAYSAKAKAAGETPETESDEVAIYAEARVTLMTARQKRQGSQQRAEAAKKNPGAAQPAPRYGERTKEPELKVTKSGWPDDSRPSRRNFTSDQETRRKRWSLGIAVIAFVLIAIAFVPFRVTFAVLFALEFLPLVGLGLSIWAIVRVRGYGGGMYLATRIVAWITVAFSILSIIGNILGLVSLFSH